ncbi:MAG: MIP/aquaporin family protein [Chloroflexota bacterium]
MAKYLTEFLGTFFVVLVIGLTTIQEVAMAPLAIGAIVMVMVYMGEHVSGGHFNPAISLTAMMRGALDMAELLFYSIAQVLGALIGGIVVYLIVGKTFTLGPEAPYDALGMGPWLVEILFTFAWALIFLNSTTSSRTAGNSFYGLAIGFVVMVASFASSHISGSVLNPAVGLGSSLVHTILGVAPIAGDTITLHIIGPLLGGVLAALVFRLQETHVNMAQVNLADEG